MAAKAVMKRVVQGLGLRDLLHPSASLRMPADIKLPVKAKD